MKRATLGWRTPLLFAASFWWILAAAGMAQEVPESFSGRIVDAGSSIPGPNTAHFTIHIDEYATADDVQALARILVEKGPDALADELWKLERGWIRIGGSLGYPLAVTRSVETPEGRVIRVLTDRPIQFFEVMGSLRSEDYIFGLAEIQLDKDGKGEGTLIAAAEIQLKDGRIEIESFGHQPFRLLNVKVDKKKKKK